ncbi:MAG TPA: VOC family protein [Haliangiales bacterium]|nr:VOC family protein [Haliangiales bacterium]
MAKVNWKPDGYHSLTPYLNLKGADKAIEFYKKAFGAEEQMRMPGPDGLIAHAEIRIGDSNIMLSEATQRPESRTSLWLYVSDCDAVFNKAVAAGATVKAPLEDMFWGDRYGLLADPFGQSWSVATHREDVSPAELEKRAKAAMAARK